ncbi:nuclease [Edaphobacter albus]|uniref:nuclease n=1 Tax=Edaphobacter sp. 4G125 TaxID=2763071 RepID=UPI001643FF2C|nr:nuclease [Edaphobacter sp. 4G125]QNI36562.1 nuclease [Edaphobacter sp. 4G125]
MATVCLLLSGGAYGIAQQIGSVGVQDATVSGALEVSNGRARLLGASTVTARDHTAEVTLQRGGTIRVCSTSGLHLAAGKGAGDVPLMMSLDRGAIEIATHATASDVVMTPDLRFSMKAAGPLDLSLRVARNGDTCVENRGAGAPALAVTDQFGESSYEVKAGQHVLFEHGSLKEVVDNEREPCGCPAAPVVSVADAGVTGATPAAPGSTVAAKTAAEQHPFPAAVSAGLAPTSGPPQAPAGTVHAQISTTMSYGGEAGSANTGDGGSSGGSTTVPVASGTSAPASNVATTPTTTPEDASASTATAKAQAPPPAPAPPPSDVFHSIGRFFKRLFGGH